LERPVFTLQSCAPVVPPPFLAAAPVPLQRGREDLGKLTPLGYQSMIALVEGAMGQLIVRGLDDRLIQTLKQRAARGGRSAEAEHRAILEQALRLEIETFAEAAARLRGRTPKQATDSAELIRHDRDRDHDGLGR
jgi:plasmid stability protein